jgi:hypothetical protein
MLAAASDPANFPPAHLLDQPETVAAILKECYTRFRHATSDAVLREVPCAVCAQSVQESKTAIRPINAIEGLTNLEPSPRLLAARGFDDESSKGLSPHTATRYTKSAHCFNILTHH